MNKRILAFILALVMCVSLLPFGAMADTKASGTDGNISWSLNSEGTLTISGTGAMKDYNATIINGTYVSTIPWKDYSDSIVAVEIESGITNIGGCAFIRFGNLESVKLADTVKSIGNGAFRECKSLRAITIPDSVESIAPWAFSYCSNLAEVRIGNSVKTIGDNAFSYCPLSDFEWGNSVEEIGVEAFRFSGMKELVLPDSVKTLGNYAFAYCSLLESAKLSSGIKTIPESLFESCNNLTEVYIPEGVTSIGNNAFIRTAIRDIDVPNSVKTLKATAFSACASLESVSIGNGVTTLNKGAFNGCPNLVAIYLGSGIKTVNCEFTGCRKLSHIYYNGTEEQFLKIKFTENISDEFATAIVFSKTGWQDTDKCGKDLTWRIDGDTLKIEGTGKMYDYDGDYDAPWSLDGMKIRKVELPEGLERIGFGAMYPLPFVEEIAIPASVKEIGLLPFTFCPSLKSITVDENNEYFCSSDGVLYNKDKTELLAYPAEKTETSYTLAASVESFEPLSILANNYIKNLNVSADNPKYSSKSGVVYDKAQKELIFMPALKTSLTLPATVERVAESTLVISDTLKTVTLSAAFKDLDILQFLGCTALSTIKVDSNNPYYSATSGVLFNKDKSTLVWYPQAKATTSYKIPSGVTKIGDYAFLYAQKLTKVTVPKTVKTIGDGAFLLCDKLETFDFLGSNGMLQRMNIGVGNDVLYCVNVYVSNAPYLEGTTSAGKPKLSWDKITGAEKYYIYRSTDGKSFKYYASTTGTSYTDKSATLGKTYYYKVKGVATYNGQTASTEYSEIVKVKCTIATPSVKIARLNGKAKLSWGAVSGAGKYYVYRSTDGKTYKYYASTTKTSYTDTKAASGTKYYYKVKAVTTVSGKELTSAYSSAKSLMTTLAAPSVKITTSNGKPKLSWGSVTGADKYYIYRSTDGKTYKYYTSTAKTSYTNTGAKKGTKYYYKVKAVNTANESASSAQSSAVSIKATK